MKDDLSAEVEKVIPMSNRDLFGVALLGGLAGVLVWLAGVLVNRVLFEQVLCRGDQLTICSNSLFYSELLAIVIIGGLALFALIKLLIYRPLLVLIASLLSVWGLLQSVSQLNWEVASITMFLVYAVAFGAFTWLARLRNFWICIASIIILVVSVRLVAML